MTKKEIYCADGIVYSFTDGGYHKDFTYGDMNYSASLLPNAMTGSYGMVLKVDNKDDINNITAPEDKRRVFFKRFNSFKEENLSKTIREFLETI